MIVSKIKILQGYRCFSKKIIRCNLSLELLEKKYFCSSNEFGEQSTKNNTSTTTNGSAKSCAPTSMPTHDGSTTQPSPVSMQELNLNSDLKSPISLVHEIAQKRGLTVSFEVVGESGPPHLKTFVTTCVVGEIKTQGEGTGKKIGKTRAAELMLEELKKLYPVELTEIKHKPDPNNVNQEKRINLSIQTIGSGAYGAPRSLYVNSPHNKILFNCGEGTRRLAKEHQIGMAHVSNVFFTSNSWQNVSGIPGLQQLIVNQIMSSCTAFGPAGLNDLMTSFSCLVEDSNSSLKCVELQQKERIELKEGFSVQAVPLYSSDFFTSKTDYSKNIHNTKDKLILSYICTIPPESGVVNKEKLVSAGVPPGTLVHSLKEGKSVTLSNGRVVHPYEVSINVFKGATFIVVEIPEFNYLDSLTSCSAFSPHQDGIHCKEDDIPEVIIHFTPPEIMLDPRYRQWANSFSPFVSHLVINKKNTCLGLKDSVEMQLQLNQIYSKIFPLHSNPGVPFATCNSDDCNEVLLNPNTLASEYLFHGPTVQSNSLLEYWIRPRNQFKSSSSPVIYPQQVIQSCFKEDSVLTSLNRMNHQFEKLKSKTPTKKSEFPIVSFLGTGSAWPTNRRNASGILLSVSSKDNILLDCGEGTFNQLLRFMGEEVTLSTLRDLKLVFISHHHHDHHTGLPTLLIERQNAFKLENKKLLPLYILANSDVIKYLQSLHQRFVPILDEVILINNYDFAKRNVQKCLEYSNLCASLDLEKFSLALVEHVNPSFGVALSHNNGWKIVYSGDCMPSDHLAKIGLNCDLLIHEATFEDGMEEDAIKKRHCTVSQAIQVGKNMNAKHIILNHFSQRYNKIPLLQEENMQNNNVGIAFDFMKVTLEDLPYLSYIYQVLKELYYNEFEKANRKSQRRSNSR